MTPDCELLRDYANQGDEASFAELVRRQVNWVYSTALRLTAGDTHLAKDVAQIVFTDLARKAGALSRHPALGGWLHTATRYAAAKAVARESARRVREQEASTMQTFSTEPEIFWEQLGPLLDEAIGRLAEADRNVVVLRFFEGKSHREVGELLGLSEDTARKRVERSVDKLRTHFNRRGIPVSAVLLAEAVDTYSVQAAPAELAGQLSSTALAGVGSSAAGFFIFLKSFVFMSTTTKIIVAASALVVAVTSYHYLTQTPDVPATKVVESASPPKPTVAVQATQPRPVPAAVVAPTAAIAPVSRTAKVPVLSTTDNPLPTATDKNMQEALAMMAPLKQSFGDMYAALMETNDPDTALEKINLVEAQLEGLQTKVKGTPLEQQVAPAIEPLKAIQVALQHGDLTAARKILQSLNSMGPKIQTKIQNTAGMTIDQAAKSANENSSSSKN